MTIHQYLKNKLTLRQYIGLIEGTHRMIVPDKEGILFPDYFKKNKNNQYELERGEIMFIEYYPFRNYYEIKELLYEVFHYDNFETNNFKEYCKIPFDKRWNKDFKSLMYKKYGHVRLNEITEKSNIFSFEIE